MVKEFESVSLAMAEPDADFDALTKKMERLQVGSFGGGCEVHTEQLPDLWVGGWGMVEGG